MSEFLPFWICPYCNYHISLIGDPVEFSKKIKIHTMLCVNRKFPNSTTKFESLTKILGEAKPSLWFERRVKILDKTKRCPCRCSGCGSQCGGVLNHTGPHQCPAHYKLNRWLSWDEFG